MKQKNEPSIIVPVCEMGGFGDIIAAYNLILSLKGEGLPLAVLFDDGMTHAKFTSLSSGSLDDIAAPKSFKQGPFLVIYPVGKRGPVIQAEESIGNIHVLEYDHGSYRSLYHRGNIVVDTGLGFDPAINNPQAGIYLQQSLESLLQEVDEASETPGGILSLREKAVEDILGSRIKRKLGQHYLDDLLKGGWSIYYPSTLDSKYTTFFRILSEARSHLQEPMTVFCMTSKEYQRERIKAICQKYGFSYVDCQEGRKRRTRGHITVVEFGTIPQRQFQALVSLADTLSLVTGDQSLSQMLQKGMSRNQIPFLYEFASWKNDLFRNLCRHIDMSSEDAVTALKSYVFHQAGVHSPEERNIKVLAPGEMAALFYDDAAIKGFTQALPGIRDSFIRERQEAGVAEAEKLWSVTDTVSFIAQRVLGGMETYEAVEPLLTPAARAQVERLYGSRPHPEPVTSVTS